MFQLHWNWKLEMFDDQKKKWTSKQNKAANFEFTWHDLQKVADQWIWSAPEFFLLFAFCTYPIESHSGMNAT